MGRKKGRRKNPFKPQIKRDTVYSIIAIMLWLIGILVIVSFSGQGVLLKQLQIGLRQRFGFATLIIPYIFITAGLMVTQVKWRIAKPNVFVGSVILFIAFLGILRGGTIGSELYSNIAALIQPIGAYLTFASISIIGFMIMTETPVDELLIALSKLKPNFKKKESKEKEFGFAVSDSSITIKGESTQEEPIDRKSDAKDDKINIQTNEIKPSTDTTKTTGVTSASGKPIVWETPPVSLLSNSGGGKADRGDLKQNASIIESVLQSFGIKAKVVEVNCGPAVTQYALEISLGTKLSKITALQNDLALALAAPTGQIRIEAPIPGRSMVGIEIPNRSPEFVTLRTMLTSDIMKKDKSKLLVALGLNVSGQPVVADISRMPHLLIAGATGSGKSVALNAFLASILFRASPDEVKMILVDPKRVELTGYNDIPHLLTPVIVEPDKVVAALKWAVTEMTNRYKLFAEVGVRNIESYNELSGFQAVPYIIIMIDELADIMLFAPKEVEESITKLAQMARATGIHLVLATQRPSVDVLTGLIKANVPTRIAFNVTTMVDSRVILDSPGAEKLLGKGDMLYIPPNQAKPTRVQGTYVSDSEIKALIDFIKQNGLEPEYADEVTTKFQPTTITGAGGAAMGEVDTMFEDAVRAVTQHGRASASLLQRLLSIGYARAARVMDQLEQAGVVSPSDGSSKPREVLIKSADDFFARQKQQ